MESKQPIALTRETDVITIPNGTLGKLPAGAHVRIMQRLGGSFTVSDARGGLYRITSADADALGLTPAASPDAAAQDAPFSEKRVWDELKTVFDPEIPVNIVDLGLVYDMKISPLPSGQSAVSVKMTLTAPGCGMGGVIAGDAQQRLLGLPGVEEANVEIVWEPGWHHSMITPEGRRILGLD